MLPRYGDKASDERTEGSAVEGRPVQDEAASGQEYFLRLDGPGRSRVAVRADSVEAARALAIRHLGSHLIEHPEFAGEGHWRLQVESEAGRPYFHVIVATVTDRNAPREIDARKIDQGPG